MNPLNSVKGAITTGIVLALLLALAISPTAFNEFQLARWLHILAGVMWIGLLYYFNVVQTPGLAAAAATRAGRAAPASPSTSRRRRSSGSAGPQSPPG